MYTAVLLIEKFSRTFYTKAYNSVDVRECLANLCFGFASFAEVAGGAVFFFSCVPADFDGFNRNFQLLDR
jgi:hypothetical protein